MDTVINKPAPTAWVKALDQGLADIEAGRVVPLEPVLARARLAIARLEGQQAAIDTATP